MDALSDIRIDIDNIDRQLLRLLAQVIANRRKEALELGLSPDVAESVWRSMIKAFIALEEKVNKE